MIIAVKETSLDSPESSIYLLDTTQVTDKNIAVAIELEDSLTLSYDDIENHIHNAHVNPPRMVERIVEIWF